jgi:hypothetical protein
MTTNDDLRSAKALRIDEARRMVTEQKGPSADGSHERWRVLAKLTLWGRT